MKLRLLPIGCLAVFIVVVHCDMYSQPSPHPLLTFAKPLEFTTIDNDSALKVGDTVVISWNVDAGMIEGVVLYVSIDSGLSWSTIADNGVIPVPRDSGVIPMAFNWIIGQEYPGERPAYPPAADLPNCQLKIEDYKQSGLPAEISDLFRISRKRLFVSP